ncbi:MAG: class I SAM-dependent methyltransferase [Candidatus Peregrinibacteria bacterium]|nr:class I SAM-dependent methyltransferase [Candidatus Peregrinibacteria bacterium]MCB9807899.1 class I SAM-dependent methyltransferase [Candidatus Peribacteria bacterium]
MTTSNDHSGNQFDEEYYSSDSYTNYLQEHDQTAEREVIAPLLSAISPEEDWTFLDVGCAMGGTLIALKRRGYSCKGTEISPYCLKHSPVKKDMVHGTSTNIPFDDNSFDVVLNCGVFEYLTCQEAMQSIDELIRVAKRYVSLWVFSPNSDDWSQQENPDIHRMADTQKLTYEDYKKRIEQNGATIKTFFRIEDTPSRTAPEWHFLIAKT